MHKRKGCKDAIKKQLPVASRQWHSGTDSLFGDYLRPNRFEIGKQLGSMDGIDHINSFVFDEYAIINQEIGPISTIKHDL